MQFQVGDTDDLTDGKVILAILRHLHNLGSVPYEDACHDAYRY